LHHLIVRALLRIGKFLLATDGVQELLQGIDILCRFVLFALGSQDWKILIRDALTCALFWVEPSLPPWPK
jgi:hypothetical protein